MHLVITLITQWLFYYSVQTVFTPKRSGLASMDSLTTPRRGESIPTTVSLENRFSSLHPNDSLLKPPIRYNRSLLLFLRGYMYAKTELILHGSFIRGTETKTILESCCRTKRLRWKQGQTQIRPSPWRPV